MKYSFKTDYSEGACIEILEAISNSNKAQEEAYGEDIFSIKAAQIIRNEIKDNSAAVHFVSGGTQANMVVLSSMLKPYESVIAASTSHIAVHETGAIEAAGHKINAVDTPDGKLEIAHIESIY